MSGLEPVSASCSLKRVRMVRRSWLTPVSMAVRCSIWRSMRSRIWMKAKPARRTSSAPRGRKSGGIGRPLPKLSAASASCQDRLDLVAQEGNGDRQQHQRGADHPDQEDMGVGGIGLIAAHEDAQHLVVQLDADFDHVGIADRVDPERPVDLSGDLGRENSGRGSRRTASDPAEAAARAAVCRSSGRSRSCAMRMTLE